MRLANDEIPFLCAQNLSRALVHSADTPSERRRECAGVGPAPSQRRDLLLLYEMTASLTSLSSALLLVPLAPPPGSVGEVPHLMHFEQKVVRDVKCGQADPHSDGPFEPVHAKAFVQSTYDSLVCYDLTHGPHNGAVA